VYESDATLNDIVANDFWFSLWPCWNHIVCWWIVHTYRLSESERERV